MPKLSGRKHFSRALLGSRVERLLYFLTKLQTDSSRLKPPSRDWSEESMKVSLIWLLEKLTVDLWGLKFIYC